MQIHIEQLLYSLGARRQILKLTKITEWTGIEINFPKSSGDWGEGRGQEKKENITKKTPPNPTKNKKTANPKPNTITQNPTRTQTYLALSN